MNPISETSASLRTGGLSSFALHIIAMALMLCDHLWGTFLLPYDWLTCAGRIAFPLFAFMLAEGFFHTGSRKAYARRLFLFALITEIPFNLMMGRRMFYPIHQNVLWTFLLAVFLMSLYERIRRIRRTAVKIAAYPLVTLAFFLLGFLTFVDYYGYGILMAALFYFTRVDASAAGQKRAVSITLQILGMYWINFEMMKGLAYPVDLLGLHMELPQQGLALLALPLIWLYHGKQGPYNKSIRALYYWFYPVHMLILAGIVRFFA